MVVVLGSLVLALLTTWPLVLHLGSGIAAEGADPLLQAWQVAWDGHALLHQPFDWFQSNTFYPLANSLAFSDALIGYTPAGLIGHGPTAALVRYDLLFMGSYALALTGAYVLARELGVGRIGALITAVAFAYAPFRVTQWPHLHVLSSGGIPLALALLVRGYRRESAGLVVAGWLVATWQVSLGFTLGLQLLYLLLVLGVWVAWRLRRRRTPLPARRIAAATAAGIACLVAVTVLIGLPYLAVLHDHPEARRTLADVHELSPPPIGLLAAGSRDAIWAGATDAVRSTLDWPGEQCLWPGAAILILAFIGARTGVLARGLRRGLILAVAVTLILAFGLRLVGDWSPYRLLYEFAPGWQGVRTPGRIFTLTSLALALLAGAGMRALLAYVPRPRIQAVVGVLVAAAVLAEGYGVMPTYRPQRPPAVAPAAPRLYLPSAELIDSTYMWWSTAGFPPIVNGLSGFVPNLTDALRAVSASFPDAKSVALFQSLGIRSVVLTGFASPQFAQQVTHRSLRGLPVTVHDSRGTTWWSIAPGS